MSEKRRWPQRTSATMAVALFCLSSHAALIGHWPLDELSGSTAVDEANGNNGSNSGGGLTWQTGMIGGAAALDGASTVGHDFFISSIPQMSGASRLSISCWINSASDNNYKGIFMTRELVDSNGAGRNWGMAREANGHFDGRVTNLAIDSSTDSAPAGQWLHVVLVWDGVAKTKRMYVNGVANPTSAVSASTPSSITSSGGWYIGLDSSNIGRHFNGVVDDLAVWNSALSASEVATIYQGGLAGLDAPSALAGDPPPVARDYFVATNGLNSNAGTIGAPLRDISKAAQMARPGDTVYIRGGIYRETIFAGRSGEEGRPIVFTAYNGEDVVVTTTDEVTGWTLQSGDINQNGSADSDMWKATVNWDANDNHRCNTLFVDGVLQLEAREGCETDPLDLDDWIRIETGDIDFDGLTADDLKGWGDDFWNGAKIYHHTTDWSFNESVVGDYVSSTGYVEFQDRLGYIISQKQRFGCYIYDTIRALNDAQEWFKGEGSNDLYYKAQSGVNPNNLLMEFKKREYTFVLNAADYIQIIGMEHRGGAPYVDEYSDYCLIKDNRFYGYGKQYYGRMRLGGSNNRLEGNELTEVFADALIVSGVRHDIVNNRFHRVGLHPAVTVIPCSDSRELFISHNTFSYFTRSAMRYYPFLSELSYNLFEHGCRTSWDTAYLDGDSGGGQGGNSLVHHNVLRNGTVYGSRFTAFYSGNNFAVYRNLVYDMDDIPVVHMNPFFTACFHNTMINERPYWRQQESAQNAYYRNNIQMDVSRVVVPGLKVEGNVDYQESYFVDYNGRDLRLSAGSAAIDAGVVISGITGDYNGAAPDAGALEYGETMWEVGHDFSNPPTNQYAWAPVPGMNLFEDGNFTGGDTVDIWSTDGLAGQFNGNGWNVEGLSPSGNQSYRVQPTGRAWQTFDRVKPNSWYRAVADVRLISELFDVEGYDGSTGTFTEASYRSETYITDLDAGEWLSFNNIDFSDGSLYDRLELSYSRDNESDSSHATTSALEIHLDSPTGTLIGTIVYSEGVYESYGVAQCSLSSVTGTHTVYLVPTGPNAGTMWLNSARFYKTNPQPEERLTMRVKEHGFGDEITMIGKPEWDDKFEGMLIKTGPATDSITVEFDNQGSYEAYIDRFALFEVEYSGINAASYGYALQSSMQDDLIAGNALDGSRDELSAVTETETDPWWLVNLRQAYSIDFLRITVAPRSGDTLGEVSVSLWREDPRLGGEAVWENSYPPGSALSTGQSLIIRADESSADGLTRMDSEPVCFVRLERSGTLPLTLAEVEVHSALPSLSETDGTVSSSSTFWRTAFNYGINPTHITVVNGDTSTLDAMRVLVRDESGSTIWYKDYSGSAFFLEPEASFDIPGNEIGADGSTRLASLLGYRVDVEKLGTVDLALDNVIVHDGNTVLPQGNLALDGEASQIGNYYKSSGQAKLASNGLIFPIAEFSSASYVADPWWQVELAQDSNIEQIVLFNRTDAYDRLNDFKVSVLNASGSEIWSQTYNDYSGSSPVPAGGSMAINQSISGARTIKIQIDGTAILSLPEVQVWGEPTSLRLDPTDTIHHFDLGTAESPVESGWTRLSPETQGDVWWEGQVESVDHGTISGVNKINQDSVLGERSAMLNLRVTNGIWRITFNMGDMLDVRDNMQVWSEGLLMTSGDGIDSDPDNSPPGPVPYLVFDSEVSDGVLNLQFVDNGGADPYWSFTRLSIERTGDLPTTPTLTVDLDRTDFRYDLGTETSPVAAGWEGLSPNISGDISWSTVVSSVDRGAATDELNRDLIFSAGDTTLEHALSDGTWIVELTMGDAAGAHDQMQVVSEDDILLYPNSVTTTAGEFLTVSCTAIVTDGALSLDFADLGGSNPDWVANSIELRKTSNLIVPVDSDGDNLPDIFEHSYYGHPTDATDGTDDFDIDKQGDGHEFFAGTDPLNSDSFFGFTENGIEAVEPVTLEWYSVAGRSYSIFASGGLDPALWRRLDTTTATGPVTQYPVTMTDDILFFRIEVNP